MQRISSYLTCESRVKYVEEDYYLCEFVTIVTQNIMNHILSKARQRAKDTKKKDLKALYSKILKSYSFIQEKDINNKNAYLDDFLNLLKEMNELENFPKAAIRDYTKLHQRIIKDIQIKHGYTVSGQFTTAFTALGIAVGGGIGSIGYFLWDSLILLILGLVLFGIIAYLHGKKVDKKAEMNNEVIY